MHFNSHAHVERDHNNFARRLPVVDFNSHAHVERDSVIIMKNKYYSLFQLTRSRGAWLGILRQQGSNWKFQLTRSRGAWPITSLSRVTRVAFQLTRSRGAWPYHNFLGVLRYNFNSHAHVERDNVWYKFWKRSKNFNSHAHVERDSVKILW